MKYEAVLFYHYKVNTLLLNIIRYHNMNHTINE